MDALHAGLWRCVAELVPQFDNPDGMTCWCWANMDTCSAMVRAVNFHTISFGRAQPCSPMEPGELGSGLTGITSLASLSETLPGVDEYDNGSDVVYVMPPWSVDVVWEWMSKMSRCRLFWSKHLGVIPCEFVPEYFMVGASRGGVSACQWVATNYARCDTRLLTTAFYAAGCAGHMEVCEWLMEQGIPCADDLPLRFMDMAMQHGKVDVCQWLIDRFGVAWCEAGVVTYLFGDAATNGHLAMCQWLTQQFGLTPSDARDSDNWALRGAALLGHLDVCRWLTEQFHLGPQDVGEHCDDSALTYAAEEGHLEVCRWLVDRFQLTAQSVLSERWSGNSTWNRAAKRGQTHVCRWLAERFNLDPGTLFPASGPHPNKMIA